METTKQYNGWTNRDTWAAHLWLTGFETTYNDAVALATGDMTYEPKVLGMVHLLNGLGNPDGIDYKKVNWAEVILALKEE